MMGALGAAPDQPGRLPGVFDCRALARWLQHSLTQLCTQGRPTAFQPPTVPR
jgi:hypothetical protein